MSMRIWKKILAFAVCCVVAFSALPVYAAKTITPSQKEYAVEISDARCAFFGNEKKVDFSVGKKYFLTYTVDKVANNGTTQSGMVVTNNQSAEYPYLEGTMRYKNESLLMDEGYTYFLRFEMTKDGMQYIAAKAKDEVNSYVKFPVDFGGTEPTKGYFGFWTAETGTLTASLSHVRCYDEDGNDLGVYGSKGVMVIADGMMDPNTEVAHSYEFSLEKAKTVAISNARPATGNVVYMEYTVKNVNPMGLTQSGVINTITPTASYPFGDTGVLQYNQHTTPESKLLTEGARYILRFEKDEAGFTVIVKRMINGVEDYVSFGWEYGQFMDGDYYSLWFGEFSEISADFVDVKCYDEEGNNLGIQTNQSVLIIHHGNLEDYSQCEAVYYCKERDTFVSLDDACNASKWRDGESTSVVGTYYIRQTKLYLTVGEDTEEFDYVFDSFSDTEGNTFLRLRDRKVRFVSGVLGGEELEQITVTAKDGYKLSKPSEPTKKNNTFKGWCLGDGTEYDFDSVVTEALTLYARWEDGHGHEYLATEAFGGNLRTPIIVIGISVVLIAGTSVVAVVVIRKGKEHEKKH